MTLGLQTLEPPFYVIDLDVARGQLETIREAFARHFPSLIIAYSYKTNYVPGLLRSLHEAGAFAEVVSSLEFSIARRLGVPAEQIVFNGPNKSVSDVADALDAGVLLNVDSLEELEAALRWSRVSGRRARFGARVNIEHPEQAGHRARSRFGLTADSLKHAAELIADADAEIVGLHAHLSSKRRDVAIFESLCAELGAAADIVGRPSLEYVDVGGGFGHAPAGMPAFDFPSFSDYATGIHGALDREGLTDLTLVIEPGMALVSECVSFYAPVTVTKSIGGRNIAFVDGSVHNVKPTRHGHNLPTRVLDAVFEPRSGVEEPWDIVGYTCMDDDYIAVAQSLPTLAPGDVLEMGNVGAYTIVFNPPFIRTRPPIYLRNGGSYCEARRGETFEEFMHGYEWDDE